jgi:hypothetical protein
LRFNELLQIIRQFAVLMAHRWRSWLSLTLFPANGGMPENSSGMKEYARQQ